MSSCIVTGAAAGNGEAIARTLRRRGHYVVAVDLSAIPDGVADKVVTGNVMDESVVVETFEAALNQSGPTHLVNNAGITIPEYPQSNFAWDKTIDVNLTAPFRWARCFAEHVTAKRISEGSIVFIGSLATTMGFPRNPAYQAAKAGIIGLTRSFAFDLGPFGIRSNCVSPGYIHTAMTEKSFTDPTLNAARRRHTVLGRWGASADVANAVAFLCDSASSYITGINLPVDGGWMIRGLIEI